MSKMYLPYPSADVAVTLVLQTFLLFPVFGLFEVEKSLVENDQFESKKSVLDAASVKLTDCCLLAVSAILNQATHTGRNFIDSGPIKMILLDPNSSSTF